MTKTGFRLLPYLKAKNGSSGSNEFNDLENRKSRGIPLRDTASRKRVDEALKFLDRNLHGLRRGTAEITSRSRSTDPNVILQMSKNCGSRSSSGKAG